MAPINAADLSASVDQQTPAADLVPLDLAIELDLAMSLDGAIRLDGGISVPTFAASNDGLWGGEIVDLASLGGTSLLAISKVDAYRSNDAGLFWLRTSPALPLDATEFQTALSVGTKVCIGTSAGRVFCAPFALTALSFSELVANSDLGTTTKSAVVGLVERASGELTVATTTSVLRWDGNSYQPFVEGLPGSTNRALYLSKQMPEAVWLVRSSGVFFRRSTDSLWQQASALAPTSWGFATNAAHAYLSFSDSSAFTRLLDYTTALTTNTGSGSATFQTANGVTETGRLFRRTSVAYEAATSYAASWSSLDTDTSSAIDSTRAVGDVLYGVGPKGLFRIAPTLPPAQLDAGIEGQNVRLFAAPVDSPSRVFAATLSGIFRFDHATSKWIHLEAPNGKYVSIVALEFSAFAPAIGMATMGVGNPGRLLVTEDHGDTWTLSPTTETIAALALDPYQDRALACFGSGLKESVDRGQTWNDLAPDGGVSAIGKCIHLVAHPNPGVFFAAADRDLIWRSVDGGASWQVLSTSTLPSLNLSQLIVDPGSIDHVYANLAGLGAIEVRVSGPVSTFYQPASALHGLTRDPVNPAILYGALADGVTMSNDGGATWTPIPGFAEDANVLFTHPADRRQRWVGTPNRGAYYSFGDYLP